MLKKVYMIAIISLLSSVTFSGIYFPARSSYSYINSIQSIGEERNLVDLIFSTNREELKNKVDTYVFESTLRNSALKMIANLSWSTQTKLPIDTQIFNTEIYYGKSGSLFPKFKSCIDISNFDNFLINSKSKNKFIFMLIPLKQEVSNSELTFLQNEFGCKSYKYNFYEFQSKNEEVQFVDLYSAYENEFKYFEFGDTHWNSLGFNTALIELLDITNASQNFRLLVDGTYKENNKVLKRLGLIDLDTYSNYYKISPVPNIKKKLLIVHDSFFNEEYSPNDYLSEYFKVDLIRWGDELLNNDNLYENYEFVVFESSIDIFFDKRILFFQDKINKLEFLE